MTAGVRVGVESREGKGRSVGVESEVWKFKAEALIDAEYGEGGVHGAGVG